MSHLGKLTKNKPIAYAAQLQKRSGNASARTTENVEKIAKITKKRRRNGGPSKRCPPTPNFTDFYRFLGSPGEPQSAENRKQTYAKKHAFFDMRKKRKNSRKKTTLCKLGGMRGASGGFGGCKYTAKVCKNLNIFKEYMQWNKCKSITKHPARRAGCGGFKRSAHSAVPTLDVWMIG